METTYNIRYSPVVQFDLEGIVNYVSDTLCAPQAAERLLCKIREAIETLAAFPFSGRELKLKAGYRWVRVENYMIFYTVNEAEEMITVMRILYGASDYLVKLI